MFLIPSVLEVRGCQGLHPLTRVNKQQGILEGGPKDSVPSEKFAEACLATR